MVLFGSLPWSSVVYYLVEDLVDDLTALCIKRGHCPHALLFTSEVRELQCNLEHHESFHGSVFVISALENSFFGLV